jgi:hypothetical protein
MILDDNNLSSGEISDLTKREIQESIVWIKFVSIYNIVINALSLLGSISSGQTSGVGGTILSFYINYLLLQSGNNYSKFIVSGSLVDLETAIDKQKQYWQIVSILSIIGAVLSVIVVIVLLIFGAELFEKFF